MRAAQPRDSVTSRAFALLDCFGPDHRRLTLSDLSRRSGLPLTTTHRLASELVASGALARDDAGYFHIGLRLWELGSLAPGLTSLREIALPSLEGLHETTRENVQLAVLDGTESVYVERIPGRHPVRVVARVGSRLPVHATGTGLVLLAFADPQVISRAIDQPMTAFTDRTVTDTRQLRRILDGVRHNGYAISDRQLELASLSVAAPIRHGTGRVVAALSVVVPASHPNPRGLIPAVVGAARSISRRLGAKVDPSALPIVGLPR